jgi:hypothetical protein
MSLVCGSRTASKNRQPREPPSNRLAMWETESRPRTGTPRRRDAAQIFSQREASTRRFEVDPLRKSQRSGGCVRRFQTLCTPSSTASVPCLVLVDTNRGTGSPSRIDTGPPLTRGLGNRESVRLGLASARLCDPTQTVAERKGYPALDLRQRQLLLGNRVAKAHCSSPSSNRRDHGIECVVA